MFYVTNWQLVTSFGRKKTIAAVSSIRVFACQRHAHLLPNKCLPYGNLVLLNTTQQIATVILYPKTWT